MKKAKLLIAAMFMAVTLGLPAKAVFAAAVTIAQADLTEACATPGTETAKGITCDTAQKFYTLKAGDYTLGENLTLPDDYFIVLGGTGNFNLDLGGKTITANANRGVISVENIDKNTAIANGRIVNNYNDYSSNAVTISGVKTVLSSLNLSATTAVTSTPNGEHASEVTLDTITANSPLQISGGTLTINSGTYAVTGGYGAAYLNNVNTTITGGIFTTEGASAMYYMGSESNTLTISDGTFTSAGDNGIEFEGGNLTISGGAFTGGKAGLALASYRSVSLSGGTYKYTSTGLGSLGAIAVLGETDTSKLAGFLASGYKYNDGTVATGRMGTMDFVYLTNHTDSVVSTTTPAPEESSSTIGAPDSGRNTKETSATASILATLLASSALLGGVYAGKKHFAKKQA